MGAWPAQTYGMLPTPLSPLRSLLAAMTPILLSVLQIAYGSLVGVFGIFLGHRLMRRLLQLRADAQPSTAHGVLMGAALLSLGLLAREPVKSAMAGLRTAARSTGLDAGLLAEWVALAVGQALLAMVVGGAVMAGGVRLFDWLTRETEELAQVNAGAVGPAVVLGAMMVVLALLVAPGLEDLLYALLPLPALPEGVVVAP